MELVLPKPNEHELSKWNKVDYFARIFKEHVHIKDRNNIESQVFVDWIHHTYQNWVYKNTPLTFNQYKKLTR
jgi:hypothetical protein